ncbi:hypothetical protein ZWY2020_005297 [Hordeum vulgare]|nr:hypothetical protein ZWY2020_005297 [Hordeum vulgare]
MDAPKPTPAPAPATAAGPGLYADIGKKARGQDAFSSSPQPRPRILATSPYTPTPTCREIRGGRMSGFGDGYVGTAQDAVKILQLEKQREAERRKIEELKSKNADRQPGLLQYGSSTSEVQLSSPRASRPNKSSSAYRLIRLLACIWG